MKVTRWCSQGQHGSGDHGLGGQSPGCLWDSSGPCAARLAPGSSTQPRTALEGAEEGTPGLSLCPRGGTASDTGPKHVGIADAQTAGGRARGPGGRPSARTGFRHRGSGGKLEGPLGRTCAHTEEQRAARLLAGWPGPSPRPALSAGGEAVLPMDGPTTLCQADRTVTPALPRGTPGSDGPPGPRYHPRLRGHRPTRRHVSAECTAATPADPSSDPLDVE